MKGASLKAFQELLGHKDIKMTMRYAHLTDDVKKDAVSLLDAGVEKECSQKRNKRKGAADVSIS